MRCLIVGGTGFLGGAMADTVASTEHDGTILSRGVKERPPLRDFEVIRADRYDDLSPLEGRSFDWVFDSCEFEPAAVHRLLDVLGASIKRYVMISSISAYGTFTRPNLSETDFVPEPTEVDLAVAKSVAVADRASALAYGASYGPLKRACEIAAAQRLGDRATLLRVGLLVGAGDYTDRLTWWVRRIDQASGERRHIPVPAPPGRAVQLIDVRDVAAFALLCAEHSLGGFWNVTGRPMPLSELLNASAAISRSHPEFHWVEEEKILKAGVAPWTDMPLMAPAVPEFRYILEVSTERARSAGLKCRPLHDTLEPLLEWDRSRRDIPLKAGLTASQESALLD